VLEVFEQNPRHLLEVTLDMVRDVALDLTFTPAGPRVGPHRRPAGSTTLPFRDPTWGLALEHSQAFLHLPEVHVEHPGPLAVH
jgi:hypothetical protein